MTPKEIVAFLDHYIIGQKDAKKTVAIALRNRERRLKLPEAIQDDIIPKNILMIGPTGVGKTEIARRIAKMMNFPFIKVEASKFTEVGFVGRDVESMVRDLVAMAVNLVKHEHKEKNSVGINEHVITQITQILLPPLPKSALPEKEEEYQKSFQKMRDKVINGSVDHLMISVTLSQSSAEVPEGNFPPELAQMQESFSRLLGGTAKEIKKEITVKEAKEELKAQAADKLVDHDAIKREAILRAQNEGIIFIDEIDKIAVSSKSQGRNDPSKEGVQRDLLPIIEGSTVSTKWGMIKTDHILFIGAGAFHVSKPSELIAELQGRFPLRVELNTLDEEALFAILTQPKNSLIAQYQALLSTEKVELIFDDDALKQMAHYSQKANEKTEDIGARRLHTVIEKVLEEISFSADEHAGERITITKEHVEGTLKSVVENADLTRYIL
jgi:ATP-dependent HslUV protease ATP-binding subunit HslU